MADVLKEVDTCHGRCHVGRIGKRGHLVAEIGTGNDRARCDASRDAQTAADADQGDSHGAAGTPGSSRRQGDDGADDAACHQEQSRRQDSQSIIDHGRHDARLNPGADQSASDDDDQDGLHGAVDGLQQPFLHDWPFPAVNSRHQGCEHGGYNQAYVDIAVRAGESAAKDTLQYAETIANVKGSHHDNQYRLPERNLLSHLLFLLSIQLYLLFNYRQNPQQIAEHAVCGLVDLRLIDMFND